MDRPQWEVAEVFRRYGEAYRQAHGASLCPAQRRVMNALECCRTAALGGHLEQCDRCGHQRNAYNSCSDRHCPKCQSLARAQWLEARQAELLDTEYFHVVFTLPEPIVAIAYQNQTLLYGLLFRAAAATLRSIAADPQHLGAPDRLFCRAAYLGADPALPSASPLCGERRGLSADGAPNGLAAERASSCRCGCSRGCFTGSSWTSWSAPLRQANCSSLPPWNRSRTGPLSSRTWRPCGRANGWCTPSGPSAGPQQVLDYVGRYTHRVALSNNRPLDLADGQVSFRYKDYRYDAQQKTMTLDAEEFIRRLLLHVLPAGFQRIRYYGFLGNRYRKEKLARCRHLLGMPAYEGDEPAKEAAPDYQERYEVLTGVSLRRCPLCHEGCMQVIELLAPSRRNQSTAIPDTS